MNIEDIIDGEFRDDAASHPLVLYQPKAESRSIHAESDKNSESIPGYGFISGQQYYSIPWNPVPSTRRLAF